MIDTGICLSKLDKGRLCVLRVRELIHSLSQCNGTNLRYWNPKKLHGCKGVTNANVSGFRYWNPKKLHKGVVPKRDIPPSV